MPRLTTLFPLALATLSFAALHAQTDATNQSAPAPIVRGNSVAPPAYHAGSGYSTTLQVGQVLDAKHGIASAQPIAGVYLRVAPGSSVREIASDSQHTELRVERGLANISVRHPNDGSLLLVDLPNGQIQMLKDGLYTFNADTNTARVLLGEANAYPNSAPDAKPVKVKEDHAVTFATGGSAQTKLRSVEFYPFQAGNDLIPQPYNYARTSDGPGHGYGYAPYGFYGDPYPYYDPYYAWGYGYGPYWGGPYFGFGYGFYGGGFYGGGFHGRR